MPAAGPNSPSSVTSQDLEGLGGTTAWSDPGNAATSDDSRASYDDFGAFNPRDYLCATDFGFSVDSGATITKVIFEAEAQSGSFATSEKLKFCLIHNGAIIGGDTLPVEIPDAGSEAYVEDGEDDLWGATLTPAIVNDSSFGVALRAQSTNPGAWQALVDHVRGTVEYEESGGAPIDGTGDLTLAGATSAGAATVAIAAASARTLASVTSASIAQVAIAAVSAMALAACSTAGAASSSIATASAVQLDGAASAGAGSVAIAASSTTTAGPCASAGSTAIAIAATSAAAPGATGQGSAVVAIAGASSVQLDGASGAGAAADPIVAAGGGQLDPAGSSGAASVAIAASAANQLASASSTGSAGVAIAAASDVQLGGASSTGAVSVSILGAGAGTAEATTAGSAAIGNEATSSIELHGATSAGAASVRIAAASAVALAPASTTAAATIPIVGAGAHVLDPCQAEGSLRIRFHIVPDARTYVFPAAPRLFAFPAAPRLVIFGDSGMAVPRLPSKRAGARLDYRCDFKNHKGGPIVGEPTVAVEPAGLNIESASAVGTAVVMWISDGEPGTDYELTITVDLESGAIPEERVRLSVIGE